MPAPFLYTCYFLTKKVMVKSGAKRKATTLVDASLDSSIEMLQIADSLESNIGAGIEAYITRLRMIDVKGVAGVVKKLESYRGMCVAQEKKKTSVIGNISYAFHRKKEGDFSQQCPKRYTSCFPHLVLAKLAMKAHPLPANGKVYSSMYEAIIILQDEKPGKRKRRIIYCVEHGLIACSLRTIYRRLGDATKRNVMPKQNHLGNVVGRHPLIDVENISLVLNQSSSTKRTKAKGIDHVEAAIKGQQMAEFEEQGLSTRAVHSPSKTSLHNYHTLAATEPGVSLTKSTIHKTEKRFAAETSLRSTAVYLATVIANHFVLCEDAESEIPNDIGPGAKELHNIVNKFFKVLMCALTTIINSIKLPLQRESDSAIRKEASKFYKGITLRRVNAVRI
jgi:hypothetical protein